MYARLRVTAKQPLHGRMPGEEFAVVMGHDGSPLNGLWRKRMNDTRMYGDGAGGIEIIEQSDEPPEGLAVIGEDGPIVVERKPEAPAARPALPTPVVDLRPLIERIERLERRPLAQNWAPVIDDALKRITALERRPEPQPVVIEQAAKPQTLAGTSFRDLLNRAEAEQDEIAPMVARIHALEDQIATLMQPPALPPPRAVTRTEAVNSIVRAARERLLDIVSGHVLYEVCVLALHDNANAATLLKALADDTAAYANAIVEHREGAGVELRGSEWERTVRIIAARDHGIDAINAADDVQAAMEQALAAIGGV